MFSTTTIGEVLAVQDATDLYVSWTSTAPAGAVFQVYVHRRLAWSGTDRSVCLPVPDDLASIQVGTVDAAEEMTDFSSMLPPAQGTGDRVRLTWYGGTYQDATGLDDVAGFHVYSSRTAGGALDTTNLLATVPAYPGGVITDGFGQGAYGRGGFGRAASSFSWTSGRLGSGVWPFAVRPFDEAGNETGGGLTVSCTMASRPRPPAPDDQGKRLTYSYDSSTHIATLSWLPSPG